jgi:hypothetical protein
MIIIYQIHYLTEESSFDGLSIFSIMLKCILISFEINR